jgi:hypothetical protein
MTALYHQNSLTDVDDPSWEVLYLKIVEFVDTHLLVSALVSSCIDRHKQQLHSFIIRPALSSNFPPPSTNNSSVYNSASVDIDKSREMVYGLFPASTASNCCLLGYRVNPLLWKAGDHLSGISSGDNGFEERPCCQGSDAVRSTFFYFVCAKE